MIYITHIQEFKGLLVYMNIITMLLTYDIYFIRYYIVHYIIIHCTMYTVQCTVYTIHCTINYHVIYNELLCNIQCNIV